MGTERRGLSEVQTEGSSRIDVCHWGVWGRYRRRFRHQTYVWAPHPIGVKSGWHRRPIRNATDKIPLVFRR